MKLLLTSLFIFCAINSFSQQKEILQESISANDSISKDSISSLKFSNLIHNNSVNLQRSDTLSTSIFTQVNKLDEVFIKSKSELNAVSLGIIQKEIKPLSTYERRLFTAGDFKPIHLLSLLGGSLAVDPIINAISGRTKRMKKYIQIEKKESNLIFLENHFSDYMSDNLNIPEELIGRFLNYLIYNERLQGLIDRNDLGELYFLIGDEWIQFDKLQNEESPLLIDEDKD